MLQAQTNSKYQYFLPDSAALLSVLIRPCLHIPIPVHRGRTNKQVRSIYLCQLTPKPVPAAQQEFLFLPFPSQGCKTQATILPATLWSIFTNKICDCRNLEMLLERAHVVDVSCCHPYCRLRNKPQLLSFLIGIPYPSWEHSYKSAIPSPTMQITYRNNVRKWIRTKKKLRFFFFRSVNYITLLS